MVRIRLLFLMVSLFATKAYGQDPVFSQYYASYLYLNPAFASAEPTVTLSLNSRMQWASLGDPYQTNQISLIAPLYTKSNKDRHFGGIGLSVFNDVAGSGKLRTQGAYGTISYNLNVSDKNRVLFGVQGGMIQKSIDFASLQWGSQYDPYNGFNSSIDPGEVNVNQSSLYADIGAGLMYILNPDRNIHEKGGSFDFGGSVYHLNQPNESLVNGITSKLPMLIKIHGGAEYTFGTKFNVSPDFILASQNGIQQVNVGGYVNYSFGDLESRFVPNRIILGGWYRLNDAYIGTVGLASNYWALGFSMDYNQSSLRYFTRGQGAYEISLRIHKPRPRATVLTDPRL